MRRSAGVLLWKKENNECFVLLTHFGGPYWEIMILVLGLFKKD